MAAQAKSAIAVLACAFIRTPKKIYRYLPARGKEITKNKNLLANFKVRWYIKEACKTMMFKNHYGETVTVVLSIVMGFIMAFAVIAVDHLKLNFSNVFHIWAMVTLVILLVSAVLPYKMWSAQVTALFHLHEGSILYRLVDNILPSLILNTFNTLIVSAASVFFNEAIPASEQVGVWIQGIIHDWPITFVVSYFAAFAAEAIGKMVAGYYCVSLDKS